MKNCYKIFELKTNDKGVTSLVEVMPDEFTNPVEIAEYLQSGNNKDKVKGKQIVVLNVIEYA